MKFRFAVCALVLSYGVLLGEAARIEVGQTASEPTTHAMVQPDQVKFAPIEVPGSTA
jgi:hypothetical protein